MDLTYVNVNEWMVMDITYVNVNKWMIMEFCEEWMVEKDSCCHSR